MGQRLLPQLGGYPSLWITPHLTQESFLAFNFAVAELREGVFQRTT